MNKRRRKTIGYISTIVVVSVVITGYFIGLNAPMTSVASRPKSIVRNIQSHAGEFVMPATNYSQMRLSDSTPVVASGVSKLPRFIEPRYDPDTEIKILAGQKETALAFRETTRAFNGAPPTIPHPIDRMGGTACMACHENGARFESMRIPRMSHPYLENCTQCHVEQSASFMVTSPNVENSFVGLTAPTGGPRAFPGAPPMIPHSTWMRANCLSCHGESGLQGIRTTHPWRTNCQQCHVPSAELEQVHVDLESAFLPQPSIDNIDDSEGQRK